MDLEELQVRSGNETGLIESDSENIEKLLDPKEDQETMQMHSKQRQQTMTMPGPMATHPGKP